jgi:hypothetical protein
MTTVSFQEKAVLEGPCSSAPTLDMGHAPPVPRDLCLATLVTS